MNRNNLRYFITGLSILLISMVWILNSKVSEQDLIKNSKVKLLQCSEVKDCVKECNIKFMPLSADHLQLAGGSDPKSNLHNHCLNKKIRVRWYKCSHIPSCSIKCFFSSDPHCLEKEFFVPRPSKNSKTKV